MHPEAQSAVQPRMSKDWSNPVFFKGEAFPHEAVKDFDYVIIVAGSRGFEDYRLFAEIMRERIGMYEGTVIFVSGKAKTGGDAMIIDFCKEEGYPWTEYPADWDQHGKSAGYIRNHEMSLVATDAIVFWDGHSKGTKHMIDIAYEKKLHVVTVLIDIIKKDNSYGQKSKGSGSIDTE